MILADLFPAGSSANVCYLGIAFEGERTPENAACCAVLADPSDARFAIVWTLDTRAVDAHGEDACVRMTVKGIEARMVAPVGENPIMVEMEGHSFVCEIACAGDLEETLPGCDLIVTAWSEFVDAANAEYARRSPFVRFSRALA